MHVVITEHRPSPTLQPFVRTYWSGSFNRKRAPHIYQSVVPNGCIELIIHLSEAHCSLIKGDERWCKSPPFTLLGLYTQSYQVQFANHVTVFGISFHPDGIRHLFGVPPAEFLATYENGVDVLGQHLQDFCARIRALESTEAQLHCTNQYLSRQLTLHHQSYDYTHVAMKLIRKVSGITDYQTLTAQVPISDRQLQREFKNQYGITVVDYMRLARMNAIQNYMRTNSHNLTQLSHDLHFTDQSHFIREFKKYVGLAPGKFTKNREKFIVNPVKKME